MLLPLAEQLGDEPAADRLLAEMKSELEDWFDVSSENDDRFLAYQSAWGSVFGYPDAYGSTYQLNDHHFHYGYLIRAAAAIAERDPAWAADWGGAVELLIRDAANWIGPMIVSHSCATSIPTPDTPTPPGTAPSATGTTRSPPRSRSTSPPRSPSGARSSAMSGGAQRRPARVRCAPPEAEGECAGPKSTKPPSRRVKTNTNGTPPSLLGHPCPAEPTPFAAAGRSHHVGQQLPHY